MGNCVGVKGGQAEIGGIVDEAPILSAQGDAFEKWKVGATAIGKYAGSLTLCAGNGSEPVARRIEDERASFGEDVRTHPEFHGHRHADDEAAGRLVNVGLNSGQSRREILLRVSVIAVDSIGCEPAIEMVAVTNEKTAGVRTSLRYALAAGVFGKKSSSLQADLRARFLSGRADSQEKSDAGKHDGCFSHVRLP